jgi:hypothetical protein
VEWIESLGRPDDHAELIAHHYERALELLGAAGSDVSHELKERAKAAFRRAGDRAMSLHAYEPAADNYGGALALTAPDDPGRAPLQVRLARSEFSLRSERRPAAHRGRRGPGPRRPGRSRNCVRVRERSRLAPRRA